MEKLLAEQEEGGLARGGASHRYAGEGRGTVFTVQSGRPPPAIRMQRPSLAGWDAGMGQGVTAAWYGVARRGASHRDGSSLSSGEGRPEGVVAAQDRRPEVFPSFLLAPFSDDGPEDSTDLVHPT